VTLADGMSEAFGNVFSEAQAMGVPVVSNRHGGIPETVKDGVTGLLAEERNVEMLAAHLLRYLEDDGFWTASREEGLRWVRSRFDVKTQTALLEQVYDAVIDGFARGERVQRAIRPVELPDNPILAVSNSLPHGYTQPRSRGGLRSNLEPNQRPAFGLKRQTC
jgi:hypothetical protein